MGYAALLGMNDKTLMDAVSALDFGGDPLGINGHCSPEKLHSIHEGMMRALSHSSVLGKVWHCYLCSGVEK